MCEGEILLAMQRLVVHPPEGLPLAVVPGGIFITGAEAEGVLEDEALAASTLAEGAGGAESSQDVYRLADVRG
jgi:hypothetical protein